MIKKPGNQFSPPIQLLIFIVVFALIFTLGNLIGAGIAIAIYGLNVVMDIAHLNFTNPQTLYILQITTTTIPIFAAPVVFAYWVVKNPADYLKPALRFPWTLFVVAFFIMLISSPLIELLSNINQQLVLPKALSGLEKWMKDSEESARRVTMAILQMHTIWDVIKNVFLIGFLTAVAEEFMFRGGLQTILGRWTKNTHVAIWVTAALFSAFHMEFYGFLPRLLLGAIFGYLVAWSGSIWPAVWGHFLNNASAVIATYLYQNKFIKLSPEDTNVFNTPGYLLSLIIIINLLLVYKKVALGKNKPALNGEELG
jgi:membrane protease YdiL (CAAX protease family)